MVAHNITRKTKRPALQRIAPAALQPVAPLSVSGRRRRPKPSILLVNLGLDDALPFLRPGAGSPIGPFRSTRSASGPISSFASSGGVARRRLDLSPLP